MILLQTALLFLLSGEGRGDSLIPLVTAPGTWRLGALESVFIRALHQSESFLVTVSLVSYPDKKTTFSSALLPLTPENRFRGAVTLSVPAEDSPGEFVYLVAESEVFREEMRIPVTSAAPRNDPGNTALQRRRHQSVRSVQSVQSVLTEPQIQEMTSGYRNSKIQQCCRDGSDHYSEHENCTSERSEALKRSRPPCYRAYEECCKYTERHMVKELPMSYLMGEDFQIPEEEIPTLVSRIRPEEEIRITVTQHSGRGTVIHTFTMKINPSQDVSVQVSSPMFNTNINMSFRAPPPADGGQ